MSWLRFLRRAKWDRERLEEIRSYVQIETDANIDRGMQPAEAHAAALRKFGNPTLIREEIYRMNTIAVLETLHRDLRYAVRGLRRNRTFTIVAVLTLALGIGASTAIFTVVNGVLLHPLPFPDPGRLVRLWETIPKQAISHNPVNAWNFLDWRERTRSFDAVAAIDTESSMNISGEGEPVAVPGMGVSVNFFDILRVRPQIGRTFTTGDEVPGQAQVAILSHDLWRSRFAEDPSVLGKKLIVDGTPHTIVGVMPAGFSLPGARAELWLPMPIDRSPLWRQGRSLSTVARLGPGVTLEQAGADLKRVATQLAEERPGDDKNWSAEVVPLLEDVTRDVRTPLFVLLGAVGFLLLIACANVANLFLMRGAERSKEIALRETLGASRRRIFSQLLTESLLISILSGALGVLIGHAGLKAVLALLPEAASLPRTQSIALDARVFACAIAVCVLTAVLFGLVPLIRFGRHDVEHDAQHGLRWRSRVASKGIRRAFVCTQIALALVLSAGAGLMARSLARLVSVQPGFDVERVLAMDLSTPGRFPDRKSRSEYLERILSGLRATPGVQSASTILFLPLEQETSRSCFTPPQDPLPPPTAQPDAQFSVVGPGYFTTMGIPLERGREFDSGDRFGTPSVIVVNSAFVRKFYRGENPIGKHLVVCWTVPNPVEIVGIAGDSRQMGLRDAPEPTIFVPNLQAPSFGSVIVRARNDPAQIVQSAVAAIHGVNPDQAIAKVRTLREVAGNASAGARFQSVLMLIFAAVALLLASIGVYGVVSYSVAQRTAEIGLRVAVGASRGDIAALILKEGILLLAIGGGAGLAATFGMTRFLRTLLYEISPSDPATLAWVCGLLAAVAAIAIALPVRRATRVDPMTALRYE